MIFEGFDRVWCFLFMTASIYSLGMISWFLQAMQYPNVLCGSYWPVHFLTSYRLLLSTSLQSDEVKFQQTYMQVVGSKGPRFCSHRYVVNPPLALKSVQCRAIGIRLNTPKRWQLEIWHEISSPHNWLFPHMKTTIFFASSKIIPVEASRFFASKKQVERLALPGQVMNQVPKQRFFCGSLVGLEATKIPTPWNSNKNSIFFQRGWLLQKKG